MKITEIYDPLISNISKKTILIITLAVLLLCAASADQRDENIDVFLVLDKSLSMVEEIDSVKEYVVDELIEKTLIPGDFFLVIQFYGTAELLLAEEVGRDNRESLTEEMRSILADGRFTDIGNALDTLQNTLKRYDDRDRRRYMLLITDGIQEAPPESQYYSPDGSFNHQFLENSKIIQKQGWKIHILGIGSGSAARELAETLSGTYTEVETGTTEGEAPSETEVKHLTEQLTESTEDLLSIVTISGRPRIGAFSEEGKSSLVLSLKSSGYENEQTIRISTLYLGINGREYSGAGNVRLTVQPESEVEYEIPLSVEAAAGLSSTEVEIRADFTGGTVFTPAIFTADVAAPGFMTRYWPYLLAALLVLILIALLVLLISKGVFSGGRKLELEIDWDDSDKKKFISLPAKEQLFISEGISGIDVGLHKTGEVLATLHSEGDELIISTDKDDLFLGGALRGNVLGKPMKIKDRYGKYKGLTFVRRK
ncbi:vWA domain-containing protein [Marispirochaeta aestuarii]|uniref:vWA domain-containing protein n=1 Tax=Marispirochaeta aestuarii TaxID=1963862 RepID=UPI0029C7D312|nr:vWA domain-containing protein [Marispirochaeta aestuarii]